MKPKILLVYAAVNHPLRANTAHLIECFRRYGDAHWFYLNLAHKSVPSYATKVDYDLVIFQTTFMQRLSRSEGHYLQMTRRASPLALLPAPKAALVQDEFWNSEKLERFIRNFDVEKVFSVAPESEWSKIYPNIDRIKVRFHRVLTGYLDEDELHHISRISEGRKKTRDIVYRAAGKPNPAWGRFGFMKQLLADAVRHLAPKFGLSIDISTEARDALFGDDWLKFLASARYTLGAPSGASLLDRDGRITEKVEKFRRLKPEASFEEIEAACFRGMDGNLQLSAIGPRHLEACATRTCQILIEGDYDGLLKPGLHYIPVAPDLSDLSSVLAGLTDEERRQKIVERAFDDIVRPMHITYRNFVDEVLKIALNSASSSRAEPATAREIRTSKRMKCVNSVEQRLAKTLSPLVNLARKTATAFR